jgi:hypothetical protein
MVWKHCVGRRYICYRGNLYSWNMAVYPYGCTEETRALWDATLRTPIMLNELSICRFLFTRKKSSRIWNNEYDFSWNPSAPRLLPSPLHPDPKPKAPELLETSSRSACPNSISQSRKKTSSQLDVVHYGLLKSRISFPYRWILEVGIRLLAQVLNLNTGKTSSSSLIFNN